MNKIRRLAMAAMICGILGPATTTRTSAQLPSRGSGSATRGSGTQGSTQRQPTFEQKFWDYLTKAKVPYLQWRSWPGKAGMYEGQSPHGAHLKMYINSKAAADTNKLADGSVIVKENYGQDQRTLMAITVMYKAPGYNPRHNNWYWIKYNPDGSVARTPAEKGNLPIRGRFASCINCHTDADGGDLVFAND